MPVFKYTVANKQGKTLAGSVEAPDLESAKVELNNLGFSVIELSEADTVQPAQTPDTTKFVFEAIDKSSRAISGTIPANDSQEAFDRLKNEYDLTVTAIWPENSSPEEIAQARQKGIQNLAKDVQTEEKEELIDRSEKTPEEIRRDQIIRNKIEFILKKVHELLASFGNNIESDQKADIERKIDKLLRIKSSTNLDYVLVTARDILKSIQQQETNLQKKGLEDQRIALHLRTKQLIGELQSSGEAKTLSEDIVRKIENLEQSETQNSPDQDSDTFKIRLLRKVKGLFETPIEIKTIKEQIRNYNSQLIEFGKLYLRERRKEYRGRLWQSIKTIWKARKKAKNSLRAIKHIRSEKLRLIRSGEKSFTSSALEELNSLTGWLLFFYVIYYFVSLYITSKDFGLTQIPQGFFVYETHLFKFILVAIFLLHSTIALKINFFRNSFIATIILIPAFFFGTIIVLLNF